MSNYKEYKELLTKTYGQAVEFLLQKYGHAQDDYFRKNSYQRFMIQEIKSISKGKISRTSEGLYCHHIDENKYLKMGDPEFIKRNKIPFESQRKDRLVYCDLVEHGILHVLIAKETNKEFGYPGYSAHMRIYITSWYLDKEIPKQEWMKNCYKKSFLLPQEAFDILKEMQKMLGLAYPDTLEEYHEIEKRQEEERLKRIQEIKQWEKEERDNMIMRANRLHSKSSRQEIVSTTYYLKYEEPRYVPDGYKEFDRKMKKYTKDKILEELKVYLESLKEKVESRGEES